MTWHITFHFNPRTLLLAPVTFASWMSRTYHTKRERLGSEVCLSLTVFHPGPFSSQLFFSSKEKRLTLFSPEVWISVPMGWPTLCAGFHLCLDLSCWRPSQLSTVASSYLWTPVSLAHLFLLELLLPAPVNPAKPSKKAPPPVSGSLENHPWFSMSGKI